MREPLFAKASGAPGFALPPAARAAMVAMAYLPLLHAAASVAAAWAWGWKWGIAILYLAPPLAARIAQALSPLAPGKHPVPSRAFFTWWFLAQCQVVFNRLGFLEELLRLLPGVYSLWLRLWGARIGAFTYWAAGVVILDRSLVAIGDRVAFGAGVRINPHVLAPGPDGRMQLSVGPVMIGSDAMIGGYSLLTAGVEIGPGEITPARLLLTPFATWKGNGRVRTPAPEKADA